MEMLKLGYFQRFCAVGLFAQVPADDANLKEQHEPGGGIFNQQI